MDRRWKRGAGWLALLVVAAAAWWWYAQHQGTADESFVSGNGRIEATEIAVASRLAGRIVEVLVKEGDVVDAGQVVARLQADGLLAQRDEARARQQQAELAVGAATVQVAQAQSNHQAALAVVVQRETDLESARRRLPRSEQLARDGFFSDQLLDDDRAKVRSLEATLAAARAQAGAAEAAVKAAHAQVEVARSNATALSATLQRIEVELADSELKAPRAGRVQFLVAHPGEIVAAGGRVLSLVDLTDVYMTFFLPERLAGRVAMGREVRIVLDAAPGFVVPAKVSFVSSTAQFTPKTVETASEREKLMFRVRAQVDQELLLRHQAQVKTGLPGVAWLRLDPNAPWPAHLASPARP